MTASITLLVSRDSNANSRAGVTGYSSIRTPNGDSAFSIAEMIAPAAGTQPDLPTPLTPSGLSGEGIFGQLHLDPRHVGRARQQIVGKGGGDGLRLFVVAHPFEQRVADRVRDAADELALDDHRIDDAAAVVDHDIAQDAHAAGLDVDLDLDGMAANAIGERGRHEALHAFEPRLEIARHGIAGHARHRFGDFAQREPAAGRAGDLDAPVAHLQIARARLQQMSRDRQRLLAHGDRRHVHRGAGGDGLPAGEAALAVGDDRGVAGDDRDIVRRHAELLGADLRQRGLDALPHRHRAGVDRDAAGAADPHDAGFERAAAGPLHAVADPDAEIAAVGARAACRSAKPA